MMVDLRSRSFPVVDQGKDLVGMIAREDIMRALQEATSGYVFRDRGS
jgi:predicted transcriptional regulator